LFIDGLPLCRRRAPIFQWIWKPSGESCSKVLLLNPKLVSARPHHPGHTEHGATGATLSAIDQYSLPAWFSLRCNEDAASSGTKPLCKRLVTFCWPRTAGHVFPWHSQREFDLGPINFRKEAMRAATDTGKPAPVLRRRVQSEWT